MLCAMVFMLQNSLPSYKRRQTHSPCPARPSSDGDFLTDYPVLMTVHMNIRPLEPHNNAPSNNFLAEAFFSLQSVPRYAIVCACFEDNTPFAKCFFAASAHYSFGGPHA